jgi:hypothetical protein
VLYIYIYTYMFAHLMCKVERGDSQTVWAGDREGFSERGGDGERFRGADLEI